MNQTLPETPHSTAAPPVWDRGSLADPHHREDKAQRVNAMFDAIAPAYDLNNRLHSCFQDQRWRRRAVDLCNVRPGIDRIVDVACGTGDLAFEFARRRPLSVLGLDFVPRMIEHARAKADRRAARRPDALLPHFAVGDAMALDLPDACADIVSIAFGIRNVADPAAALREFRRILAPGGRLLVLEFDRPSGPLFGRLYDVYFHRIMPVTASLISRDGTGAYRYLPRSVDTFLTPAQMKARIEAAGFRDVSDTAFSFGICRAYLATVADT